MALDVRGTGSDLGMLIGVGLLAAGVGLAFGLAYALMVLGAVVLALGYLAGRA